MLLPHTLSRLPLPPPLTSHRPPPAGAMPKIALLLCLVCPASLPLLCRTARPRATQLSSTLCSSPTATIKRSNVSEASRRRLPALPANYLRREAPQARENDSPGVFTWFGVFYWTLLRRAFRGPILRGQVSLMPPPRLLLLLALTTPSLASEFADLCPGLGFPESNLGTGPRLRHRRHRQ